ncbi:MAG: virulence factor BrkB family protein [Colwellia sp.]|nr:virulence factor BrkB family protein [Colwellia sp.]
MFLFMNKPNLQRKVQMIIHFTRYFLGRLWREQLHVSAGYLSYVTLMSLIPLLVVMLSTMTAFPIFSEIKVSIESFIYENFLPATGDAVKLHIAGFVENATKMSAIALIFLFALALLLISAIDKTLNQLWEIKTKRRFVTSLSVYWLVLTLGPILVGASIATTSYIVSLVSLNESELFGLSDLFVRLLPLLSSISAFLILYLIVPNKVVRFKCAFWGALVAGLLFEIAKAGFAQYITQLPTYETIYGALAGVPILFLWVYLSWLVVLFGALFTLALENFKQKDYEELS